MTEKQNTENQNAEVYANPVTEREESPAVQAERQSAEKTTPVEKQPLSRALSISFFALKLWVR